MRDFIHIIFYDDRSWRIGFSFGYSLSCEDEKRRTQYLITKEFGTKEEAVMGVLSYNPTANIMYCNKTLPIQKCNFIRYGDLKKIPRYGYRDWVPRNGEFVDG